MNAPPLSDLVYAHLNIGADRPTTLSELAERLGVARRSVEAAVEELRHAGRPVASSSRGIWIAQTSGEMRELYRTLRHRVASQSVTAWAVRQTAMRMERAEAKVEQTSWLDLAS